MELLEIEEIAIVDEPRPLRYRLGATLLPVGADPSGYDLRCCSCGFGSNEQPATCPVCASRAWELVRRMS